MNITKPDVLFLLSKRPGRWVKAKRIAKELGLNTTAGINRVSNILYRLRDLPYIERKSNSHAYKYRYIDVIGEHPTNVLPLSKSKSDKKGTGESEGFTFIELIEPEEKVCEVCGVLCNVFYQAEKDNKRAFLCKECGERVNKELGGYGDVFG